MKTLRLRKQELLKERRTQVVKMLEHMKEQKGLEVVYENVKAILDSPFAVERRRQERESKKQM